MALSGAAFGAEARYSRSVAINLYLNVGYANKLVGIGRSLDTPDLRGLIDHFAEPGHTGKIIAEDRVHDGRIIDLNCVGNSLLQIDERLTVRVRVRFLLADLLTHQRLGRSGQRKSSKSQSEQKEFFHRSHQSRVSFRGSGESVRI